MPKSVALPILNPLAAATPKMAPMAIFSAQVFPDPTPQTETRMPMMIGRSGRIRWNQRLCGCAGNIRFTLSKIDQTVDHKDHPGLHNAKGYIGWLGHGDPVAFRNVRIKELP